MSVELFLNEVLAKQEDRDLLMANPKILEEGERIAHYVKTQQMVITEMAPGLLPLAAQALAIERGLTLSELGALTTANAERCVLGHGFIKTQRNMGQ